MSTQIDRRDIEDLMVPALRQYQHNDCSGLVAGYDLEKTISIIADIMKSTRDDAMEEAAKVCEAIEREKWQSLRVGGAKDCYQSICALKMNTELAKQYKPDFYISICASHGGFLPCGKDFKGDSFWSPAIPLYTKPPRQKEPLSDEQILDLWEQTYVQRGTSGIEFARAIERSLGIGGEK